MPPPSVGYSAVVLLLLIVSPQPCTSMAAASKEDCDILVYSATPAGCSAAYTAARLSSPAFRVCLVEPSAYLGGMMTAGGIGLRDTDDFASVFGDARSFASQWAELNRRHYAATKPVLQPDMVVGNASLYTLLLSLPPSNALRIVLEQPLAELPGAVVKVGTRITQITTVAAGSQPPRYTTWTARVFIDASYDGDVVMAANVSYTSGREPRSAYNETLAGVQPFTHFQNFLSPVDPLYANGSVVPYVTPGSLPPEGAGDDVNMPYSYRPCLTRDPRNQVPFYPPPAYDPADFVLLQRYLGSFNASAGPAVEEVAGIYEYKNYPAGPSRPMRYDLCEGGKGPQGQTSPVTTDQPEINNGYVPASRAGKAAIAARVRYYVQGFMYYLSTDPRVPSHTRNTTNAYGYCKDTQPFFGPAAFPPQLYVREGVRLVGDFVSTYNNVVRGRCEPDAISTSSWTIDIHPMRRVAVPASRIGPFPDTEMTAYNEGQMGFLHFPGNGSVWEVRYAIMLPKRAEASNLLVPVCVSVTHVVFGSIRVEPTFLQLGQAAGAAAWLAARDGVAVHEVSIAELQALQRAGGVDPHYGHTCP